MAKHLIPVDELENDFRSELRRIVRMTWLLKLPLQDFFELAERQPSDLRWQLLRNRMDHPRNRTGIRVQVPLVRVNDEAIEDQVTELAKAIWHLGDRLTLLDLHRHTGYSTKLALETSFPVRLVRDVATVKKHHTLDKYWSGSAPFLGMTHFDVGRSGPVEFAFDHASRTAWICVSEPNPIYVDVPIFHDIPGQAREDTLLGQPVAMAKQLLDEALAVFVEAANKMGVFASPAGVDPENPLEKEKEFLRMVLMIE